MINTKNDLEILIDVFVYSYYTLANLTLNNIKVSG